MTAPTVECAVWLAAPLQLTDPRSVVLDPVERRRLGRYRAPADRRRFLTGRVVARTILGQLRGAAPEEIRLDCTCPVCGAPHGPPRLADPDPDSPNLSISHSGDLVAVALVRSAPVGVDVERLAGPFGAALERRVLSAAERSAYAQLPGPDRGAALYGYWTRKEALLKACRVGIGLPMPTLTVSPPGEPPRLLDSTDPVLAPARAAMCDLDLGPDYRGCVAVLTDAPVRVRVHRYDDGR